MKDGGTGRRGDECIGKGKGSFALSSAGEGGGVLRIYTNHPGGNLAHENKTPIKFDVLRERPPTQRIQMS